MHFVAAENVVGGKTRLAGVHKLPPEDASRRQVDVRLPIHVHRAAMHGALVLLFLFYFIFFLFFYFF